MTRWASVRVYQDEVVAGHYGLGDYEARYREYPMGSPQAERLIRWAVSQPHHTFYNKDCTVYQIEERGVETYVFHEVDGELLEESELRADEPLEDNAPRRSPFDYGWPVVVVKGLDVGHILVTNTEKPGFTVLDIVHDDDLLMRCVEYIRFKEGGWAKWGNAQVWALQSLIGFLEWLRQYGNVN